MRSNFLIVLIIAFSACAAGRTAIRPGQIPQPPELSQSDELYGHQVLQDLLTKYPLDNDDQRINRARSVVDRLTKAIGVDKEPWHVYVLQSPSFKNAAATRGNHLFVWTGLLDEVKNDEELATVLAHELGHLLAGHTTPTQNEALREALSGVARDAAYQSVAIQGGYVAAAAGIAQILADQAFRAFLVYPESQRKELEADLIGLNLMAEAGYNPQAALNFWLRIKDSPEFRSGLPSFISSHPTSEKRIESISKNLPMALERYRHPGTISQKLVNKESGYGNSLPLTTFSNREYWRVVEQEVFVYQRPDSSTAVINSLSRNETVTVIGREREWLRISSPVEGWVKGVGLSPNH